MLRSLFGRLAGERKFLYVSLNMLGIFTDVDFFVSLELTIAWYTGLDCVDVAMMSFIAHAPTVRTLSS